MPIVRNSDASEPSASADSPASAASTAAAAQPAASEQPALGPSGRMRRRTALAAAAAAFAVVGSVAATSAAPSFGLTEVAAQPRAAGVTSPTIISPELADIVVAQGSWLLENPSADGVIAYYGYLNDGSPLVPIAGAEAQKTEPDKNTYVVLRGQHGADPRYDYGTHFLFQGHEAGPRGKITRVNLDADPAHRVTLIASTDSSGANLPDIDGSVWDPFTQTLLFSWEGNGTSTGGIWESTPDIGAVPVNRQGILGRGGHEGVQIDDDGNIWIVEDIGGSTGTAGGALTNNAKQPNSFLYRFVPANRSSLAAGGKLQVLQASYQGNPVTFHAGQADADITQPFMAALHTYGTSFPTRWITIHDTATDGTAAFNANALAKAAGGTPFKRPENGQFRPGSRFGEFYFTETGDTNATSGANAALGGWGGVLRLTQRDPSDANGTLSAFYLGDQSHTGLDNLTFVDRNALAVVEDAGDTLHGQRNALDSAFVITIPNRSNATPTLTRFIAEGRDVAATLDAAAGGYGKNDGDNEITGIHLSDGDPSVRGLIGTKDPQFLQQGGNGGPGNGGPGNGGSGNGGSGNGRDDGPGGSGRGGWRLFWTQQHGDNTTYEVLPLGR